MWATTLPLSVERSTVITGMFLALAASTEVAIAAESTGLTIKMDTPLSNKSATSLACLAGSF